MCPTELDSGILPTPYLLSTRRKMNDCGDWQLRDQVAKLPPVDEPYKFYLSEIATHETCLS